MAAFGKVIDHVVLNGQTFKVVGIFDDQEDDQDVVQELLFYHLNDDPVGPCTAKRLRREWLYHT